MVLDYQVLKVKGWASVESWIKYFTEARLICGTQNLITNSIYVKSL